jgi:3-oxoacyl-[acyl-carrier-protein] synthase II
MSASIRGIGMISPQETLDPSVFLEEIKEYEADFLSCVTPNFKEYIKPIAARRMSKLIKMGISAAKMALQDAGCEMPDAIITGTGLGSVEDTEKILSGMLEGEVLMNPTPFIQSTYNTISSQIAITLKCHNYNSTYVHRSFSFESALQDVLLQIMDGAAQTALAGGIDEMTLNHLNITRRTGHWKREPVNNLNLRSPGTPGALAGEGAAFFCLAAEPSPEDYASLLGVKTIFKPEDDEALYKQIHMFLASHNHSVDDLDAVILGINGDTIYDPVYERIGNALFQDMTQLWYKHLCGEYHTSTGFALWLAANIIKHQRIPEVTRINSLDSGVPKNILIYNQYRNINHSLLLVSGK